MKVIVIGGVAGGASAAARLRRLDEKAEIILLEKGEYISYANCGLPYYIGNVIKEKDALFVQTPEAMRARFNLDVRVLNEALAIDPMAHVVRIQDHRTGHVYTETYDKLVLSPGAEPKRPPIEGLDLEGIFTLRTVPDTFRIHEYIDKHAVRNVVVIGGGFIGVEMAENLKDRGIDVALVEFTDQVVASMDADMAAFLHQHMRLKGLNLLFRTGAAGFARNADGRLQVRLTTGHTLDTDLVIFCIGIAPDSRLAKGAGLELGIGGSIKVDRHLRTSDPDIYAVGDAIQIENLVTGQPGLIPLAGPANKQGRIAAENIAGRDSVFEGVQGTAVLKVFDMTAASTGLNEKQLKRDQIPYEKTYVHPLDHAGYYPGAIQMSLKMLFDPASGRILGAQAVGVNGVEKRIDVLATAQRLGATVMDLEKLELAYAPPYSSAKDPVNMLGFTAHNIIKGDVKVFHYHDVAGLDMTEALLVDVRTPEEFALGSINEAINIPLDEIRQRIQELPKDKKIYILCQVGLRGYLAARILTQLGYGQVYNLSGGYKLYHTVVMDQSAEIPFDCFGQPVNEGEGEKLVYCPIPESSPAKAARPQRTLALDAGGLQCPGPILKLAEGIRQIEPGDRLTVAATDPGFASDVVVWCERTGHRLEDLAVKGGIYTASIIKGEEQADAPAGGGNDKSIVLFSGDLDKAIAAMIIANGAASMGRKVTIFFTFWGLNVLRRSHRVAVRKTAIEKMFGWMMPRGSRKLGLSRMNMAGLGSQMIRQVMKHKNVASLEELIETGLANGIRMVACQMSMDVMGIKPEELMPGVEIGGVATMLGAAERSDTNLFV
ncbi:MAG: FAD-dependent oxidoreductase [Clostridiaceae bacterium]|jgi:NADPH-dependent 2,4-dienoyl-CoA reductase/sulfur reductase-like enzyme/peroxiredoxin family protein/rhodanese-related sulfurtransferase/TusA-related sulfurtransferase|nr:FAD-dependent oxidoreductase [Clostridiaceae bacterium]